MEIFLLTSKHNLKVIIEQKMLSRCFKKTSEFKKFLTLAGLSAPSIKFTGCKNFNVQNFRLYSLDAYPLWDSNWDKPVGPSVGLKGLRQYVLIRAGKLDPNSENKALADTGEKQAAATGKRLLDIYPKVNNFYCAQPTHCQDTARIIFDIIKPQNKDLEVKRSPILYDFAVPGNPPVQNVVSHERNVHRGLPLLEGWFRSNFYRPTREGAHVEFILAESLALRYLICRALQYRVDHWSRFLLRNCSITEILIRHDGRCWLRSMGETAHLTSDLITIN